jgi:hypothetical protein
LEIEFDSTFEDVVEFNLHIQYHQDPYKKTLKSLRIFFIIGGTILALIGIINIAVKDLTYTPLIILCFAGALFSFFNCWFFYDKKRIKNRIRKALIKHYIRTPNVDICRHKFSISEEGVYDSIDFGSGFLKWTAFSSIVQTENYIYFFLLPIKAYFVPRRAFSDDSAFNLFADRARKYMSATSNKIV